MKNLAFKQKKHSNTIYSPNIIMDAKYQSNSKHSCESISICNNYGTKTYIGRDNYSVNMLKKIKIIILEKHQVVLLILFQII